MNDCIFCKIINKEIPSYKVYEDTNYISFLDINPKDRGHTLVVPKKHTIDIFDTNSEDFKNLLSKTQEIAKVIKDKLKCDGIRIQINNGGTSGQVVFHIHVHIIPSYENNNLDSKDFENIIKELA